MAVTDGRMIWFSVRPCPPNCKRPCRARSRPLMVWWSGLERLLAATMRSPPCVARAGITWPRNGASARWVEPQEAPPCYPSPPSSRWRRPSLWLRTGVPLARTEEVFESLGDLHRRGDALRCIMEREAYALRDDKVRALGGSVRPSAIRCAGGAARSDVWLSVETTDRTKAALSGRMVVDGSRDCHSSVGCGHHG